MNVSSYLHGRFRHVLVLRLRSVAVDCVLAKSGNFENNNTLWNPLAEMRFQSKGNMWRRHWMGDVILCSQKPITLYTHWYLENERIGGEMNDIPPVTGVSLETKFAFSWVDKTCYVFRGIWSFSIFICLKSNNLHQLFIQFLIIYGSSYM
jgi:hypothetical protein